MAAASDEAQTDAVAGPTAAEFEAFDSFPWSKHKAFLLGLIETLGGVDALLPNPTHQGSTTFCRTVFYRRQTGRPIDLVRYNAFLAAHPAHPSIDHRLLTALYAAKAAIANSPDVSNAPSHSLSRRIVEIVSAAPVLSTADEALENTNGAAVVPSWQRSAPKNELHVPRTLPTADSNGEAPYSDKFAKIVEAVQTGKELEGVRHIPDTVVRQAGITPLGKLRAPKKPWEMAASTETPELHQPAVDLQFPPPPEPTENTEADKSTE